MPPEDTPTADKREGTTVEWRVPDTEAGERLDRVVAAHIAELSRSFAASLIESGALLLNGKPATRTSQRVKTGDLLSLTIPPPEPSGLKAEAIPLSVVYEDADLLVIDKPAGMVVHPAPGHSGGTLVNALLAHVPNLELDMGDEARPGIVHRLDKETSGLMVVAKRRASHEVLARQMAAHSMLKEYVAAVLGTPHPPTGVIDAPIARDPRDRLRMAVVANGRLARTRYEVEEALGRYALVKVTLETGRTHQIRVHMASRGHPVLGDPVYGKRTLKDATKVGLERQFLHARRLGFALPSTGEWREFTSSLPADLQQAVDALRAGLR